MCSYTCICIYICVCTHICVCVCCGTCLNSFHVPPKPTMSTSPATHTTLGETLFSLASEPNFITNLVGMFSLYHSACLT